MDDDSFLDWIGGGSDRTARLVCAGWLEERGDRRAVFWRRG